MLITFVRGPFGTASICTIDVAEDHADSVVTALTMKNWQVVNKVYGPVSPWTDLLQVALLEVSTMPFGTPVRFAVELAASTALSLVPATMTDEQ